MRNHMRADFCYNCLLAEANTIIAAFKHCLPLVMYLQDMILLSNKILLISAWISHVWLSVTINNLWQFYVLQWQSFWIKYRIKCIAQILYTVVTSHKLYAHSYIYTYTFINIYDSLTRIKRQLEANFVCSGIVENTDKIKQPNTRRKLQNNRKEKFDETHAES